MAKRDIEAGQAIIKVALNQNPFLRGIQDMSRRMQGIGTTVTGLGTKIAAAGAAIGAPLLAAAKHFANVGDQLDKMSARTGVGVGALAELGFAAEQSGTNIETVEKGFFGLSRALFDAKRGSAEATDSLAELGLTFTDLEGKAPDEQLQQIADKMVNIEDASLRGALAQRIFGRAGRQLLPMLEGMRELRKEARELGLSPSEESTKAAAQLVDANNRIKRAIEATVFEIGAALAPMLLDLADGIKTVVLWFQDFVKSNQGAIRTALKVAAAVAGTGTAIVGLGLAIKGAGIALGMLAPLLAALTGPIGLVTVALGAGVFAWARYTESGSRAVERLRSVFGDIASTATETFAGIKDAIIGGDLALAGEIAVNGLQIALLKGFSALSEMLGGVWADTLGTLGTQLASGEFKEAWDTTIALLGEQWALFSEGLVAVFTQATRLIIDAWEKATKGISDSIVDLVSNNSFFSRLVLGVDLVEEQKKLDRINAERRRRGLRVDEESFAEGTKRIAREGLGRQADSFRTQLDTLDRSAQERSREAAERRRAATSGGNAELLARIAELEESRKELLAAAAEASRVAKANRSGGKSGPGEEIIAAAQQARSFGTFNTAAAARGGSAFSREVQLLQELVKIARSRETREKEKDSKPKPVAIAVT